MPTTRARDEFGQRISISPNARKHGYNGSRKVDGKLRYNTGRAAIAVGVSEPTFKKLVKAGRITPIPADEDEGATRSPQTNCRIVEYYAVDCRQLKRKLKAEAEAAEQALKDAYTFPDGDGPYLSKPATLDSLKVSTGTLDKYSLPSQEKKRSKRVKSKRKHYNPHLNGRLIRTRQRKLNGHTHTWYLKADVDETAASLHPLQNGERYGGTEENPTLHIAGLACKFGVSKPTLSAWEGKGLIEPQYEENKSSGVSKTKTGQLPMRKTYFINAVSRVIRDKQAGGDDWDGIFDDGRWSLMRAAVQFDIDYGFLKYCIRKGTTRHSEGQLPSQKQKPPTKAIGHGAEEHSVWPDDVREIVNSIKASEQDRKERGLVTERDIADEIGRPKQVVNQILRMARQKKHLTGEKPDKPIIVVGRYARRPYLYNKHRATPYVRLYLDKGPEAAAEFVDQFAARPRSKAVKQNTHNTLYDNTVLDAENLLILRTIAEYDGNPSTEKLAWALSQSAPSGGFIKRLRQLRDEGFIFNEGKGRGATGYQLTDQGQSAL